MLALAGAVEEELGGEEGPDLTWGPGGRNLARGKLGIHFPTTNEMGDPFPGFFLLGLGFQELQEKYRQTNLEW